MARTYRKPTPREEAKMEEARKMTEEGIQGQGDVWSKISTTMAKQSRDLEKLGTQKMESVAPEAREYKAYEYAGYKKGGMVKVRGQGCCVRKRDCKMC